MSVYFSICVSLSVGLILGAVGGGVKKKLIKKDYTQKQIARNIKFISKAAGLLKYVTCLVLLLGLLWCSYYLILGIMEPKMAEYANNMSELIVAVLSVICGIYQKKRVRVLLTACKERKKMCAATVGAGMHIGR